MSNMETAKTASLFLSLPTYSQLICNYDERNGALWYYMNPKPRPCFTPTLLNEIRDLQDRVRGYISSSPSAAERLHYLVMASAFPKTFNLGGDLKLFVELIVSRKRDTLYDYGKVCVEALYQNATNLGVRSLTTISIVQGTALGGGFEAALGKNVLIAEESAQMGLPEILFNLFPGMGAYSLLSRRIDPRRAEALLRSGSQYSGRELAAMGVVDVLAKDGEGVHAVNQFIRNHSRARNGQQAIQQVCQRVNPLSYQELIDVVEIWVDAALRLTARDLRMMTKLVAAQERLEISDESERTFAPVKDLSVARVNKGTALVVHSDGEDRRVAGGAH